MLAAFARFGVCFGCVLEIVPCVLKVRFGFVLELFVFICGARFETAFWNFSFAFQNLRFAEFWKIKVYIYIYICVQRQALSHVINSN